MRACLVALVILTGCLHAQTPASRPKTDPSVLSEFNRLVGDANRIEDAATYAAEHHLSREDAASGAARAYAAFMRMEAYAFAAEVAWSFDLGQKAMVAPAALQHDRAATASGRYLVQ